MVSQHQKGQDETLAQLKVAIQALDPPPPARVAPQITYHLETPLKGEESMNQQYIQVLLKNK